MLNEVLQGLKENPKRIPSKYFYDEVGSKLFDEICELKEYYPTRTEMGILVDNIDEIVKYFPDDCVMIEFGSGSSLKTKVLLKNLMNLKAYVPVDISEEHLYSSVATLKKEFPQFNIKPLPADYT
ncbi:MAG: L-histidine N(alpha)-methyltransferase, partial [Ignavibacteria bacterium]